MELTPAAAQYLQASQKLSLPKSNSKEAFDQYQAQFNALKAQFDQLDPTDRRSLREDQAVKMRASITKQLADPNLDAKFRPTLQASLDMLNKGQLPSGKGPAVDIKTGEPVGGAFKPSPKDVVQHAK